MNSFLKYGTLAVFVGATGAAQAQTVDTKGGVQIKSADGKYEAKIGGRIHLDTNFYVDDDDVGGLPTDVFFRRARLTLEGKALDWAYKFESDMTSSGTASFREMWIGTKLGGANLRLGQAKPYRSLEELTSSNEVLFMERPFASASGMYDGRQFQIGAFLDGAGANWGWGTSLHSLREASGVANDGFGATARFYYAPIVSEASNLHLGLSYSLENPDLTADQSRLRARARAAGRAANTPRPTFGDSGNAVTGSEVSAIGLEFAYQTGPFFVQAEYAMGTYENDSADVDVDTFYVQASYLLGGASKRYDVKKGVFKSPSVKAGTAELKARYDVIENDVDNGPEIAQLAVGMNYYFNSNVRAMVEYVNADIDPSGDKVGLVSTRLQFSF
jgi:phosphate-selective porin OprO and OprP